MADTPAPSTDPATALRTLLDHVDYTSGACRMTELVGAVLPREVIALCRASLAAKPEPAER
jgi:hypothetical protein